MYILNINKIKEIEKKYSDSKIVPIILKDMINDAINNINNLTNIKLNTLLNLKIIKEYKIKK